MPCQCCPIPEEKTYLTSHFGREKDTVENFTDARNFRNLKLLETSRVDCVVTFCLNSKSVSLQRQTIHFTLEVSSSFNLPKSPGGVSNNRLKSGNAPWWHLLHVWSIDLETGKPLSETERNCQWVRNCILRRKCLFCLVCRTNSFKEKWKILKNIKTEGSKGTNFESLFWVYTPK